MRLPPALALCALSLAGCNRGPAAPAGTPPSRESAAGPAGGGEAAAAPTPQGPSAYVNAVAALRREPTDAARIPGKPGAKDLSNYLTTLNRGEKVGVLETRGDWARVRSSDDSEGWMKRASLLELGGITEATVLSPADVFDRPDLLAANAKRKVEPGTLVLVVKSRPPFSEVNVSGSQDVWVLSERLETSAREVSVAKLCEKARNLVRSNRRDEALQILALARQQFTGAALVDTLAAELGEVPSADAASAPAAPAPVPAADAAQ